MAYDSDEVLVYSEIDPTLNGAVAGGTYGTPVYPSTIGYQPLYFLINGQPATNPGELQHGANERLLLRVISAGLRTIVPTLTSGSMSLLAEDGQRAPFARDSYSMLLPAGKTRDALLVITEPGSTVLFDRRGSSRLARIRATPATTIAVADAFAATEDMALATAAPGVLANDTGAGLTAVLNSATTNGTVMLLPDGAFAYAPAANFHGVDSFTYHATNGVESSNVATVSITVAAVNDAPVAVANGYTVSGGTTLVVAPPGLLANDSDVDGDPLSAEVVTGPSGGTLVLAANGSFQYTAAPGTTQDSFTYRAADSATVSNVATANLTVAQTVNAPPIARNDFALVRRNTQVVINVVANDNDTDGTIDPSTVTVTTQPTRGVATSLGNGTVRYQPNPNFWGLDSFRYVVHDNLGAVSSAPLVRVFVW